MSPTRCSTCSSTRSNTWLSFSVNRVNLMINSVAISKLCADNQEEEESSRILAELEHIDDECDQKGIIFVRIDDSLEAQEYGIEDPPALVYFEKGVPSLYEGSYFCLG